MRNKFTFLVGLLICTLCLILPEYANTQNAEVRNAVAFDVSIPLRDMKPVKQPFWKKFIHENEMEVANKFRPVPPGVIPDAAVQTEYNTSKAALSAPIVNFSGISNSANTSRVTPPDPAGDVGPNHYVQVVNSMLQIFSKTGTSLYGPVMTSTLWTGFSGNWDGHNNGDAIVLYDENADRWIITQFAIDCTGTPYTEYEMVAVSTTGDPTGTYYRYAFQFDYMPDYPKLGVWNDGYYMAVNRFNTNTTGTPFVGAGACVLERAKMLTGDAGARMVYFKTESLGGSGSAAGSACWAMLPSDCDGTLPATGTPNYFTYINGTSELRIWALHADWNTTSSSTFTYVTALPVTAYTEMGSGSVPEMGTLSLDGLGDRLMFRNQYRNFGSYETFLTCHSVNTGSGIAGVRWYEYRKTGSTFSLYQQSTFAPGDGKSRWMGSIAMNAAGDIGLAYSVSSSTMYPSIYYTGRKAADPLNTMTVAEGLIQTGTVSMTTYSRWGDYSAMNVDPSDNTTFWTTQEYVGTFGGFCPWATKIASFKFANSPNAVTQPATSIALTSATLNGSVNPYGLASDYHFEYGTTTSYGTNTATVSAGSGSSVVNVNANITGLTSGTTYHFRLVAVNSDGTANGSDQTFIPGAAVVSTTAASAITMTTATAGGSVTFDGGSTVTSRGVCWALTSNPTVAGSHTTDGSGTGTFTSTLTGLTANTQYHIRAYASTAYGTTYGDDLTFSTTCGTITSFPWNEGFESAGAMPNCWSQQNVTGSLSWTFRTGSPSGTPAAAHGGTYNASFYEGAYGTANVTKLVTPSLNLSSLSTPQLKFWHIQPYWSPDQDELRVYYKTSAAGAWILLATYTSAIASWTQETVTLPAQSSDYYIAFEGTEKWGYGVCLDDVSVSSNCSTTYPVSVSIAASAINICPNTGVTFTATPTNGGTTPVYQWQVNGINAGTNSTTLIYAPSNNDVVTCILTSNATCTTGNPATSNAITMVVNAAAPVSVSLSPSANSICVGTSITFTATPTNGGSSPAYQWQVNGSNAGTNSATYSYTPVNNDVVTCILTSNASCTSGNPATSKSVVMIVNQIVPASVSVSPSANIICTGTSVTYTATPTNGGSTPTYQWKVNGSNAGSNSATYSYTPANNDVVTCVLTSNAACVSASPATSNAVTIVVNPVLAASISISASANNVCPNTGVTFTATPTNGGTTPVYQWQVNGSNVGTNSTTFSHAPTNNEVVTCILISNAPCTSGNPATSNAITMVVNTSALVSVSVSPSVNNICAGTSVTFTASPTYGGSSPAYQWKVNGSNAGSNSATYNYAPANGDAVSCVLTSNATCPISNPATSNTVTLVVNPVLNADISISPSVNNICAGTFVTFTASTTNGGTTPVYQWKVNGSNVGSNSVSFSYTPANNDVVTCVLTSNAICVSGSPATSNTVTMVVNPVLNAGISISPSANNICAGTSLTYTASTTNGGSTPAYQWRVNGSNVGSNNASFNYTPANNDVVTCVLTSNATCINGSPATSNTVTMVVNPLLNAGISISPSANDICAGTTVTYTASLTNGGSTPAYQWKVNGSNVGSNSTTYSYMPSDDDVIICVLTSNATCVSGSPATSNGVTMVVNPVLAASISISPSANNICEGTSVTFTATPTNGGSTPGYQWKVNGSNVGSNSSAYTYTPANNDVVTCILTSNATCIGGSSVTSSAVTMVVNSTLEVGVTISVSANPVCEGTSVTFTATPTNGGAIPGFQWSVNGTNAGNNSNTFTYTPDNRDVIVCVLTSNASCVSGSSATSNQITLVVNPILPVSVSIAASANSICSGTSVTYSASPVNGGTSPVYQWKVNGNNVGTNSSSFTYIPANDEAITCVLTSNATCISGNPTTSNQITMIEGQVYPVNISISPSSNPVCTGSSVTFTATPDHGGSSPAYQWKVNGNLVGSGLATYAYTPSDNDVVTCLLTSSLACSTNNPATSNAVTMSLTTNVAVGVSISASANPVNAGTQVTFTATPTNGGASPVYQWAVNGVNLGANSSTFTYSPVNSDDITCQMTSDINCVSGNPANSNSVTMVINSATAGAIILDYSNVAINGAGQKLTNHNISLRLSILSGTATGPAEYIETKSTATNSSGVFDINIGQGSLVYGAFDAINWSSGLHYLKVEMDANAGNNFSTVSNGPILVSFSKTQTGAAHLTTTAVTAITASSSSSGGNIEDGGSSITARGICYSTTPLPTIASNMVASGNGSGAFVANLTGLNSGTVYYVRAYATNSIGVTYYGTEVIFSTH